MMIEKFVRLRTSFKAMKNANKKSVKRAVYMTLFLQLLNLYFTYLNNFADNSNAINHVDSNLANQIDLVKSHLSFDSLTDYDNLKMLNELLKKTIDIFEKNGLVYWIIGGTLLGAIRDKGLVQWDDDADLCLMHQDFERFLQLESQFIEANISILNYKRLGFFKLYDLNGKNFLDSDNVLSKYPFIDVFFFRRSKHRLFQHVIKYSSDKVAFLKKNFARTNIFSWSDVFPLKKYQFEDYEIMGPNNPYEYLNRVYPGWRSKVRIHRHFKTKEQNNQKFSINYDLSKKPYLWIYLNQSITINKYFRIIERYYIYYSDSFEIVVINSRNILSYLPEIFPIFSHLEKAKFQREIFMLLLLYKYGGLFVDSSVILKANMESVMNKLKRYYFVGFGCEHDLEACYGKPSITLVLASRAKNLLIENILKRVFSKLIEYFSLDEMPTKILIWKELDRLIKLYNYEYYHYFRTKYSKLNESNYVQSILDNNGSEILLIL